MEESKKRKVMINIAGASLALVTDEPAAFVAEVAGAVNERMQGVTKANYRVNRADAALLCAVDFCGEKIKAEQRVKELEVQATLYEAELAALRRRMDPVEDTETVILDMEKLGEMLRASGDSSAEEKLKSLEHYLDARKKGALADQSKEAKLRCIESLLRGEK